MSELRTNAVPMLKETWAEFGRHNSQWLAAALAYFTAFAIAPLIIVIVEIAGLFLGSHQQVLHMLYGYLQKDAGGSAAHAIQSIVSATYNQPRKGTIAQIIGWVVFFLAAIGLFNAFQFALNVVWDIAPVKMDLKTAIRQRASGFGVLFAIVVLMLLSMGLNAALTLASGALTHVFPGFATIVKILDFIISFGVITLAFALLFEYLPECRIEWRDVWVGAALTSFLFVVGQFLLGWYLGRAGVTSGFGAFGSLVVVLIWVNYTAQILLLGAEFTHVYAKRHGSHKQTAPSTTRGEVSSSSAAQPLHRPT